MIRVDSATSDRARVADALCRECGLCCDGTFFGSVVVAEEERRGLERRGLRIVDDAGRLSLPQRCAALEGCLCAVYADRPRACRAYACTTRERLLDGSTTDAVARANLARMRALLATARRALGLPDTSVWEAILALDVPAPPPPDSTEGRRFDEGIAAVAELLELAQTTFEPAVGR